MDYKRRYWKESRWRLGDLALTVETIHGEQTLEKYAEAIGLEYDTLLRSRQVVGAFENRTRIQNLSRAYHWAITSRPDRHEWLHRGQRRNGR